MAALAQAAELWWEDLEVGLATTSPGRTITEADVVAFAGVSGDFNAIHMDVVHAAEHGLGGERLAHGLLGTAVMSGLVTRTPMGIGMAGQLIAMLSIEWTFRAPLRVGDTVHVRAEVVDRRPTSRPERGVVVIERKLVNQRGEVVQEGRTPMLVRRRGQG